MLLGSTAKQPNLLGLSGHERMLLYWLGAETGLRWTELQSLTPASFEIAETMAKPFVRILAGDAKNGEDAEQPVTPILAARLRDHLATRPPQAPAFPMPVDRRGAEMMEADLAAAGIPYVDERGKYFDFHALRGMCATLLALANTPLTLAQRILRHSTPVLTSNFYTMYELEEKAEALARVPSLAPDAIVPEAAATAAAPAPTHNTTPTDDAGSSSVTVFALALSSSREVVPDVAAGG